MSKTKMRCISCGKWFQSANAKEVTCPDCTQKLRKEKLAAKAAPGTPQNTTAPGIQPPRPAVPPPPKAKSAAGGTSHWLDTVNDVKVSEPEPPVARPKLPFTPAPDPRERDNRGGPERGGQQGPGPGGYRDRDAPRGPGNYREGGYRGPGSYRETDYHSPASYKTGGTIGGTIGQRPRQPMEGGPGRGPERGGPRKPGDRKGKPAGQRPPAPPKPKREKIPPPAPFVPTPEQVEQVETRYKELATPIEFDGIRTQIAQELSIPKSAVKRIVKTLRDREGIPSWWETQTYKGSGEDLEKIKVAYLPHLPVPPVGVHKQIAEALSMKPGEIYQAIKTIRLEMNLPQYNDPSLHPGELTSRHKAEENTQTEQPVENTESGAAPAEANAEAEQAVPGPAEVNVEAEQAASVPAEVNVEAHTAPVNIGAPAENAETPEITGATAAGNSGGPSEQ